MVDTSFACRKWYWSHRSIKHLNKMIMKEKRRLKKSSFSNFNDKGKGLKPSVNKIGIILKFPLFRFFGVCPHG